MRPPRESVEDPEPEPEPEVGEPSLLEFELEEEESFSAVLFTPSPLLPVFSFSGVEGTAEAALLILESEASVSFSYSIVASKSEVLPPESE